MSAINWTIKEQDNLDFNKTKRSISEFKFIKTKNISCGSCVFGRKWEINTGSIIKKGVECRRVYKTQESYYDHKCDSSNGYWSEKNQMSLF